MNIRQAFVLGAGLGTRLRPLTDDMPKPLMPIYQKPLITFALDHLIAAGVENFVINTHHLAPQFDSVFPQDSYRGHSVRLVHEPVLLETGGGIKNAQPLLAPEPFLVYSGDILTDIDIVRLVEEHERCGHDVTLALRRTGFAAGVVLKDGLVTDITRGASSPDNFDYANVSVWNPAIFERIPSGQKISFIPILIDWIREGGKIGGLVLNDGNWFNIGSRDEYLDVHRTIRGKNWRPAYVAEADWPVRIASSAKIAPDACVDGCSSVASDCAVESGARVVDSILWPGAQIASRTELQSCIVRSRKVVPEGTYLYADL